LTFKPERWTEDPTPEMQRDYFPFGLGARQCIARNLATVELFLATRAIARENVLAGAQAVGEKIEMLEWFNSRIKGERIELVWN
jgi:cytochrome P450